MPEGKNEPGRGLCIGVGFFVVVEEFADATASAPSDLPGAFGSADANVLAGNTCALADVARGVEWVEGDEIGGALADAFCSCSGTLGSPLADVARAAAYVAAGAAGLGLRWGL